MLRFAERSQRVSQQSAVPGEMGNEGITRWGVGRETARDTRRPQSGRQGLLAIAAATLTCCSFGDVPLVDDAGGSPLATLDPKTIPATPTWIFDIQPRMDFYCVACHDADGPAGALANYDVATLEGIDTDEDQRSPITVGGLVSDIRTFAFDKRTMPPGAAPRMTARDWAIIKRWEDTGYRECVSGQCPSGKSCTSQQCTEPDCISHKCQ